jgi:cytochrome c peroxidase
LPDGRAGRVLLVVLSLAGGTRQRPAQDATTAREPAAPPAAVEEEVPLTVRIFFRPLPEKMPGSDDDTPQLIALGRKLFFERGISLNQSQSCDDCHRLDGRRAGVDNRPTSPGAKGFSGTRNAQTVLNAGFQAAQFWDGRAADLVEQAKRSLLNPIEMAMRTEQDVVNHLTRDPAYRRAFENVFSNQPEAVTFDNVARAIAAFERTLMTPARFDRYLRGQIDALTPEEKDGLHLFEDTGCIECHDSILVGGRLFKKLGIYHPYQNQSDLGRFEVTRQEPDKFVFKVPTLRNVTRTAPYFHDGRIFTLPAAVRQMAWMQLDRKVTFLEIDQIVCFLRALEAEHPEQIDGP